MVILLRTKQLKCQNITSLQKKRWLLNTQCTLKWWSFDKIWMWVLYPDFETYIYELRITISNVSMFVKYNFSLLFF